MKHAQRSSKNSGLQEACKRQCSVPMMLVLGVLCVILSANSIVCFAQADDRISGFFDFNVYPYTLERGDNVVTINVLAKLPHGFEYFSLSNMGRSSSTSSYDTFDFYLGEQNIRWMIPHTSNSLQLTAQALLADGSDNDAFRIGTRVGLHAVPLFKSLFETIKTKYWINLHGIQFDQGTGGYRWQIEHAFRMNVLPETFDNRVYFGGFADHNITHDQGTRSVWLEEAQLGVRVYQNFYGVIEQRYNGFRKGKEASMGLGVEYLLRF